MMSLYQYDNLSCLSCNRLKYVCLYKQLYRSIRSGDLKPEEVLDTQRYILYAIIELRSEEGCEYFSVEDTVIMFRMLVTMMLQIYVIGVDPFNLVALNADLDYDNDIYNQQEITKLLDYAEQYLKKHRRTYIVVSDLCLGNLQFGDLLINNKGTFRGIEVKSGKKNRKITKLVYKGKKNPYDKATNKTDWKHFERAKKQWERSKIISQQLQSKYYFNGDKGIVVYPYWADEYDSYGEILSNIIKDSHKQLYREVIIDENISIISINRAAYKAYKKELAPPCLYLILNFLK